MEEAESVLGFEVLEPAHLPKDFSLFTRALVENLGPEAPIPGSTGGNHTILAPPTSIHSDFRFRGSLTVPGVTLLQSSLRGESSVWLDLTAAGCGERIETESGPLFYIQDSYLVEESSDPSRWEVCRVPSVPPRDVHNVVAVRGGTLIEVIAFPESRITREDVIEFVKSLRPAEPVTVRP